MRALATLVFAVAVASAVGGAGCVGGDTVAIGVTTPVVYSPPPEPLVEVARDRPGYFWEPGHWEWARDHWAWRSGRLTLVRVGYVWQPGDWMRRGSAWHWIAGHWIVAATPDAGLATNHDHDRGTSDQVAARVALYPTTAPPAPVVEDIGPARPGVVFVPGHYEWRAGTWAWLAGRWEAERPNMAWSPGRWQLQGTYYVWIEGAWASRR